MKWADFACQIRCHIFPGKNPSPPWQRIHGLSYRFWHDVWSSTFKEVLNQETVWSDDFVRQEEILSLTLGGAVIGLICFDFFSALNNAHMTHSYFKFFPASFASSFRTLGFQNLMIASNLSVHPEWRRRSSGFSLSHLLFGLASKRFQNSSCDAIICFTRNDKKTNHLVYDFGGRAMVTGVSAYGIPSDIVAIAKEDVRSCPKAEITAAIDQIWNLREKDPLILESKNIETQSGLDNFFDESKETHSLK